MSTNYNAMVELNVRANDVSDDRVDELIDLLAQFHVAVGRSDRGRLELTLTLPAESLEQASMIAMAMVRSAAWPGVEPIGSHLMTTDEFDLRADFVPVPELIGTAEVAAILGVTRQRVSQLVRDGQLQATTAGKSLVFARPSVEAFAKRVRTSGRPSKGGAQMDPDAVKSAISQGQKFAEQLLREHGGQKLPTGKPSGNAD